jgi:geranylgeranyl transferase type-2 subunit alpha
MCYAANTEFDLVRNAMYTDPDDQSVWVYHRWLVGTREWPYADYPLSPPLTSLLSGASRGLLEREIEAIDELLGEQPDSKCR